MENPNSSRVETRSEKSDKVSLVPLGNILAVLLLLAGLLLYFLVGDWQAAVILLLAAALALRS